MQSIRNLNDMIVFLQQRGDKKRVAVVCANDARSIIRWPWLSSDDKVFCGFISW